MKKILTVLLCALCCLIPVFAAACGGDGGGDNPPADGYTRPQDAETDGTFTPTCKTLIAYFSKTNTTAAVANSVKNFTDADMFRIERKAAYPEAYTPTTEEAQQEKAANARPELAVYLPDDVMAGYEKIILGFPIWWHTAPMPVLSFLNYYDLSGKTIYTFCTSGGSSISESTEDIKSNAKGATVVEGKRFSGGSDGSIEDWLESLALTVNRGQDGPTATITYEKNGNAYTVTGAGNEANIIIPAEYNGLPVTVIGESAFAYSRHTADIVSVVIPDSVTEIGRNAFYARSELTSVSIGADSGLLKIGNNAFSGNGALEEIYIPQGVTEIGDGAFNNCGAIDFTVAAANSVYRSENGHLIERQTDTLIRGGQSGIIPDGIKRVAQAAFRRSGVTGIAVPVSVVALGNYFIADSAVGEVAYRGTEEQWGLIEKNDRMWNYGNREVVLTFGSVTGAAA